MLADIKSELQASDVELEAGLRDMHILVLNGELRPMTPAYLNNVLELILNALVSLKLSSEGAPIVDVTETLCSDHEISPDVSKQVMSWFGSVYPSSSSSHPGTWTMDIVAVVRQLGIGILSAHRVGISCLFHVPVLTLVLHLQSTSIDQDTFLNKWRMLAGDSFENHVDLSLLKVRTLLEDCRLTIMLRLFFLNQRETTSLHASRQPRSSCYPIFPLQSFQ